jgi:5-methylcytosine-specific restriction protein B
MARQVHDRDISPILAAAGQWIKGCLIEDCSLFSQNSLWTAQLVDEVYHAFVEHPDLSKDDFITKLKGQMRPASQASQQLLAEMLWALLLFPSNMRARTKRQQVREMWVLSGQQLPDDHPLLRDDVLAGIGSGGPGFNNYRPEEMTFLITLARDLKRKSASERTAVFADYNGFVNWITSVPQEGFRQFRHMLRFFAFPDRVERMSSNNDRRTILQKFDVASERETKKWTDQQLDDALLRLRGDLKKNYPSDIFDFYMPSIKKQWAPERVIKTPEGEVKVVVPSDSDEDVEQADATGEKIPEARQSIQVQAKLAEIG